MQNLSFFLLSDFRYVPALFGAVASSFFAFLSFLCGRAKSVTLSFFFTIASFFFIQQFFNFLILFCSKALPT
jgi:hypothetical protein